MDETIKLGWILPEERTSAQAMAHIRAIRRMPQFRMVGDMQPGVPVGTKVLLTDCWKDPRIVKALGKAFTGFHQLTGACVGAGGGNALATLAFGQALRLGTEIPTLPFWPLPYGISRVDGGMRGQGEGSMGSMFAQACRESGVSDANDANAPRYSTDDGFTYTKQLEMHWSDGAAAPASLLETSKQHLVKSTAQMKSADDVREAILNGYPVTRAFGLFCNPGSATKKGSSDAALVGSYNGRGGHQESWQGYWNHPELGELFWEQNQWGLDVYGEDPGGGPAGGVWIPGSAVDEMCKDGASEVFAFSSFEGFVVQKLDWLGVA